MAFPLLDLPRSTVPTQAGKEQALGQTPATESWSCNMETARQMSELSVSHSSELIAELRMASRRVT